MSRIRLLPAALSAEAFRPFGDVVEGGGRAELINDETARRYADLADVDVTANGGRVCVSIYRADARSLPLSIDMLERHPLSSQLFMPLDAAPFLIVVGPPAEDVEPAAIRAFASDGRQGVNYRRGTWHHPLIALRDGSEFLVVERAGSGPNCDERRFDGIELLAPAG